MLLFQLVRCIDFVARCGLNRSLSTTPQRQTMKSFKKFVSASMIVCITAAGLPFSAQARMVATEEITAPAASGTLSVSRDAVNQFLVRDDVRQAMLGQGVTPQAALERVAAMSD